MKTHDARLVTVLCPLALIVLSIGAFCQPTNDFAPLSDSDPVVEPCTLPFFDRTPVPNPWPSAADLARIRLDSLTSVTEHVRDATHWMAIVMKKEWAPEDPVPFMMALQPEKQPPRPAGEPWVLPNPFVHLSHADRIMARYEKQPYAIQIGIWDFHIVVAIRDETQSPCSDTSQCLQYVMDLTRQLLRYGDGLWFPGEYTVTSASAMGIRVSTHPKEHPPRCFWAPYIIASNRRSTLMLGDKSSLGSNLSSREDDADWLSHSSHWGQDQWEERIEAGRGIPRGSVKPRPLVTPTPPPKTSAQRDAENVGGVLGSLAARTVKDITDAASAAIRLKRFGDAKRLYQEAIARTTDKAELTKLYLDLSHAHGALREGQEFRENLRRCLDLGVDDAYSALAGRKLASSYANTLIGDNQLDQEMAAKCYEEAIARFGTKYYESLCCYMGLTGRVTRERAAELCRTVMAVDPDKVIVPPLPDDRRDTPQEREAFRQQERGKVLRLKETAARLLKEVTATRTPPPYDPLWNPWGPKPKPSQP